MGRDEAEKVHGEVPFDWDAQRGRNCASPCRGADVIPASNPAAAEIQQQLEIILRQKKEREAYERLSDKCIDGRSILAQGGRKGPLRMSAYSGTFNLECVNKGGQLLL